MHINRKVHANYWEIQQKLNPLTTNYLIIKTSQLICSANQLTGYYMIGTFVVKGLMPNKISG